MNSAITIASSISMGARRSATHSSCGWEIRGRWEGNTLVVDVTNHNDKTWFDIVGSFHSDAMRIVERWTFASPDQIDYVATIDDPKVFTKPWKLAVTLGRNKPQEQWEAAVCEGNKSVHVAFGLPF